MCYADHNSSWEPVVADLALTTLIDRYIWHLGEEGIPDPLVQSLMVSCVLADLCQQDDAQPPAAVRARVEGERGDER